MATKKATKKATNKTVYYHKKASKRTPYGKGNANHKTANSRTTIARVATNLYAALKSHADANGITLSQQVNKWLAVGAQKAGCKLSPETKAFVGL